MFSTQWSVNEIAKRQFFFKLNANGPMFTMLIVLQIIATVFLGGASMESHGGGNFDTISFNYSFVSNDGQIGLTLFWAGIAGFLLTSAAQRNESFSFVTNRPTLQLANFYFICTAALFGGVTTVLLGSVMKIITLTGADAVVESSSILTDPLAFFSQIFVMSSYVLLIMLVGYTAGTFIQYSRLFIIPFVIFWIAFVNSTYLLLGVDLGNVLSFYYSETSFLLFAVKILVTAAVLFAVSFVLTNKLEVRNL